MAFSIRNNRLYVDGLVTTMVKSPNVGGKVNPKFLVIHYTATGPGSNVPAYFATKSANVSAHLVVKRDGTVIQCVPFDTVAWHAGKSTWTDKKGKFYSGLNSSSIGIEIENWGPLKKSGGGWMSWTGQSVNASNVIEAKHKFGTPSGGWEMYSEPQVEAVVNAGRAICNQYGIDEIVGHDDIAPGRKSDPGPAWTMSSYKAKVFGRDEGGASILVVRSPNGLNVRTGPAQSFPLESGASPNPLPDGTRVIVHEAEGSWRLVSALDKDDNPKFSGWVYRAFLYDT